RNYLILLPDHASIEKQLMLEDIRTERGIMDMRSRELHTEQKRIEYALTELTRSIRGLEFDLKVNSDREKMRKKSGNGEINAAGRNSSFAPQTDKKSPKVGDFSD
ncbi:hypothetical protein KR009_007887, partial [Drosophila setifemur]